MRELENARRQLAMELTTPAQEVEKAALILEEFTEQLATGERFSVTPGHHRLASAARDFCYVMDGEIADAQV